MSRTLTAGMPTEPNTAPAFRRLPEDAQKTIEAMLWGWIDDLWRLGRQRREIAEKAEKLDAWLNRAMVYLNQNPTLDDIEDRRRIYGERRVRHRDLTANLESIDVEAQSICQNLGRHWDRLRPQRQTALRREPGWSKASSGNRVAAELWDYAKRGLMWPGGEPPFALVGFLIVVLEGFINV